jgi:hypothetical protein
MEKSNTETRRGDARKRRYFRPGTQCKELRKVGDIYMARTARASRVIFMDMVDKAWLKRLKSFSRFMWALPENLKPTRAYGAQQHLKFSRTEQAGGGKEA